MVAFFVAAILLGELTTVAQSRDMTTYSVSRRGLNILITDPVDVRSIFRGLPDAEFSASAGVAGDDANGSFTLFCSYEQVPAFCRVVIWDSTLTPEDYVRPDHPPAPYRTFRLIGTGAHRLFAQLKWIPQFKIMTPPPPQQPYTLQEKPFRTSDRIVSIKCSEMSGRPPAEATCHLNLELRPQR